MPYFHGLPGTSVLVHDPLAAKACPHAKRGLCSRIQRVDAQPFAAWLSWGAGFVSDRPRKQGTGRTYNRVLRPGLTQLASPDNPDDATWRRRFDQFDAALNQCIEQQKVPA